MRLIWSGDARRDRRLIARYISSENRSAAFALDETFSTKALVLMAHPEIGRPGRIAGTREFLVHKRYLLIYTLAENEIRILRVLHTARQWPPPEK